MRKFKQMVVLALAVAMSIPVSVPAFAENQIVTEANTENGKVVAVPYNPKAKAGEKAISEAELANLPETRAVSIPTSQAPLPYEANWSNTVNYTYTSYYFAPGTFRVRANGSFKVEIFQSNGASMGEFGCYYNANIGQYEQILTVTGTNYYAKITNTSGSAAKSATYRAY